MNIIRDGLMSLCAILYFIDFVYILRNKKFLFFEEAATMFDAWLSFFVSVTALFITISNIMSDEPGDIKETLNSI
ncbi:hypothetical protein HYG86_05170 [Alkalicella caledoniensis]|uniref:Uncharacterized protein n=1 Tax=Alkalicella caledoniensis TaxID=2731377 RepID=A0A7G9W692_ALKCA|nr:hypothetical protein [Alkalicella caledoniensis]QNO14204.1 hypothetical protein HYG86_05170 [Alkalicella caledoniensis]